MPSFAIGKLLLCVEPEDTEPNNNRDRFQSWCGVNVSGIYPSARTRHKKERCRNSRAGRLVQSINASSFVSRVSWSPTLYLPTGPPPEWLALLIDNAPGSSATLASSL